MKTRFKVVTTFVGMQSKIVTKKRFLEVINYLKKYPLEKQYYELYIIVFYDSENEQILKYNLEVK